MMTNRLKNSAALVLLLWLMSYCTSQPEHTNAQNSHLEAYQQLGDSISLLTQAALLKAVSQAIGQMGTDGAVAYCQLQALAIVDSLAGQYNCQIRRVSKRYRNPADKPLNAIEQKAINYFEEQHHQQNQLQAFLQQEGTDIYYFKPIIIGMETCLRCHGKPYQDIDTSTYTRIQQLYPQDKATGYHLGDLRGMWVIRFRQNNS